MAAKVLMEAYDIKSKVKIHINKRIPIAGGMAGGSADCAAVLRGVNKLFQLGLTDEQLQEYGVKLGADVPYCIVGGTKRAQGIGEILTDLPTPPKCYVIIAKPDAFVSTKFVYSHIRTSGASVMSCSVSVDSLQKCRRCMPLRPITILVTSESRTYSAICVATSSPCVVTISAPSCCPRRIFACKRTVSSAFISASPGVCT